MKKLKLLFLPLISLLFATFTYAATFEAFKPLEGILKSLFHLGSFAWLVKNSEKLYATKFALFIVIFAVIFFVLNKGVAGKNPIFGGGGKSGSKVSAVISFALAAITVIFIPDGVVQAIGETYSSIFSIAIVGLPLGIMLFFGFNATTKGTWQRHAVFALIAYLGIVLLNAVGAEYGYIAYSTSLISPIFYVSKKDTRRLE